MMAGCGSTCRLSAGPDRRTDRFFEVKAIGLAHRLVALVVAAAEESGYFGNWTLAFGATSMRSSYSSLRSEAWGVEGHPHTDDPYTESAVASSVDLTRQPSAVVDRLVGGVLRGFGTRQNFLPALTDPAESALSAR
jgi:hypothetical protein